MSNLHTTNILVPVGALGTGVRASDLEAGIAAGAHAIALDAGSTDSGPAYLATGKSKYSRDAVKSDLQKLMTAQAKAGIPLLIGSCGTSGCDEALDWTADIVLEIAREKNLSPKIALLYSQQDAKTLKRKASEGSVKPLAPMTEIDPEIFAKCDNIVGLMGVEPYIDALESGADIVLGGRTTDTAVLAAVPLMRGAGKGPAWHAGKIAECGGLCTTNVMDGGVMIRVGLDFFDVEPLSSENACTPSRVSAHMLYENSNPFRLAEPGGILDVSNAKYTPLNDRVVRVTGSRFEKNPYTMKLEGARSGRFQTIMLVGIQDPNVLDDVDRFVKIMHTTLTQRVKNALGDLAGDFDISLRPYGWNAVCNESVPKGEAKPREIGLLFVATANTQEIATRIAKTCNPTFFHLPAKRGIQMPSYAFPFSPAEIERGPVYDFLLNHVVEMEDYREHVRTKFLVSNPQDKEHA